MKIICKSVAKIFKLDWKEIFRAGRKKPLFSLGLYFFCGRKVTLIWGFFKLRLWLRFHQVRYSSTEFFEVTGYSFSLNRCPGFLGTDISFPLVLCFGFRIRIMKTLWYFSSCWEMLTLNWAFPAHDTAWPVRRLGCARSLERAQWGHMTQYGQRAVWCHMMSHWTKKWGVVPGLLLRDWMGTEELWCASLVLYIHLSFSYLTFLFIPNFSAFYILFECFYLCLWVLLFLWFFSPSCHGSVAVWCLAACWVKAQQQRKLKHVNSTGSSPLFCQKCLQFKQCSTKILKIIKKIKH